MSESLLQRGERLGMAYALRTIREIRPFEGLPVSDKDGVMRHGYSVINRTPISPSIAGVVLRDHMLKVVDSFRPHVADLLRSQPEAISRLAPLYTVGEMLGVEPLLKRQELWTALMAGDWRRAAGEIMACVRPAYMEASRDIQAKVNDVIFDMVTGKALT